VESPSAGGPPGSGGTARSDGPGPHRVAEPIGRRVPASVPRHGAVPNSSVRSAAQRGPGPGNTGGADALPALRQALADPDELVRDAAAWALEQIENRQSSTMSARSAVAPGVGPAAPEP